MIIELGLTGSDRKELAKAVSEIIGVPAVYQYMPTCSYIIDECYAVTKDGALDISNQADEMEVQHLIDELIRRGYGESKLWESRKDAVAFFLEGMNASDGSEKQRYSNVYLKLIMGSKTCDDSD